MCYRVGMQTHVQAVLIAVGTEITSGQIINRNTAWLAQPLSEAGLAPIIHWSVPDDKALILEAIQEAASISPLVFLTGGLGPTSDDFTRLLVAQWAGQELIFNTDSWQRIEARARKYNFTLVDAQKQQCWFPENAEVLVNPVGTADGFWLSHEGAHVIVLPGPPREVAAIWESVLHQKLVPHFPEKAPQQLYTWQCMGIPEGTLAEQVDAVLADYNVDIGYRAHFPYIEVKVWIPLAEDHEVIQKALAPVIEPWVVLPPGEEAGERFLKALQKQKTADHTRIVIDDAFTQGALLERLLPVLRTQRSHWRTLHMNQCFDGQLPPRSPEEDTLHLTLQDSSGRCQVKWQQGHVRGEHVLKTPSRYQAERLQRYVAEQFLLKLPDLWAAVDTP